MSDVLDGAICGGVGKRFHVLVQPSRGRRWVRIGKPTTMLPTAARRLATTMAESTTYERGVVTMTADYYEPVTLLEMNR